MDFAPTKELLKNAVENNVIPSAAFAVGRGRDIYISDVYGSRAVYPEKEAADRSTLYDLASLSKLVSTSMVALRLIEDGKLLLADTLSRFFTEKEFENAPAERKDITIFRLMTHTSGITPHIPLWTKLDTNDASSVASLILSSEPKCRPGEEVYYTCMGYILLKIIIERLTGETLDSLAKRFVFDPLGMRSTCYNPKNANVASTEKSPLYGEYIKGHVHDENAYFLGGVSGNAGVFSDLDDMIKFAVMCSTRGELPGEAFGTENGRYLSRRMFDLAATDYTPGLDESRGLGFQLKQPLPNLSASGELMKPGSYGHNGFTGTSLYVDSETGIWGVLLTNAVHFGRGNSPFFRMRRAFYNTIISGAGR